MLKLVNPYEHQGATGMNKSVETTLRASLLGLGMTAALGLAASQAGATIYSSTDVPVAIPDNTTVTSTLTVPDHIAITDVNAIINSITHTWDGDLTISLIHGATTVVLSQNNGGGSNNFINTIFDDSAGTAISAGSAPFTGSFTPEQALSAFNGADAFGVWTLRVNDNAELDTGSINAWSLDITGWTAVPEPSSLALLGIGLAAGGFWRRRKCR